MRLRVIHPSTSGQGTFLLPTSFVHITRHTRIRKFKVKFAMASVFSIRLRCHSSLNLTLVLQEELDATATIL
jgi:hypothetical protein